MVWETVKKEMTITRILLAIVAILLCCFITFGLSHKSENQANNEKGLEMLNLFREYLKKNESNSDHPQTVHDALSTEKPKFRKFYSIAPPSKKFKFESQKTKPNILDVDKSEHAMQLDHSTNSSNNASEPKLDLILVVDVKEQPEHEDAGILDVKNTGAKHVDKLITNHVLFSKTVRVNKVEEVFEDLVSRNVRRIIKEDRVERVEVSKNKELETIGNEFNIKDLLSL